MTYPEAILFGIVQGISEFLPISSTAHIIITELLLGYDFPGLSFEIFLHLASILAVAVYFRRDLAVIISGFFAYRTDRSAENLVSFRFGIYIIVATIITGVLGVALKNVVADVMKSPAFMAGALALTGVFLVIIERFHRYGSRTEKEMTLRDAIIVGLGQSIAILPGVSRSGSTLIVALFAGLSRDTAVRYSFILAIPVILGSSVLAIGDIGGGFFAGLGWGPLAVSFITTFVFSWLGIAWLIDFLKKGRLVYFAVYLFILAITLYFFL